jgi:hypothetical protein
VLADGARMAASAAMGALSDRLLTVVLMAAPADNAFQVAGLRRTPQAVQPDLRRKIFQCSEDKTKIFWSDNKVL